MKEQIELHELRKKCKKQEKQRKHANEFIKSVADMLNMDTDGVGYDGLTLSLDDFQDAIRVMNWVATEEELPHQTGSYLCFWENCYIGMLFFNSNKEWCEMWKQKKHKPTHWMHLPKQPCS